MLRSQPARFRDRAAEISREGLGPFPPLTQNRSYPRVVVGREQIAQVPADTLRAVAGHKNPFRCFFLITISFGKEQELSLTVLPDRRYSTKKTAPVRKGKCRVGDR